MQPAAQVTGRDADRDPRQSAGPVPTSRPRGGSCAPARPAVAGDYLTSISLLLRFQRSNSGTTSITTAAIDSVIVIPPE